MSKAFPLEFSYPTFLCLTSTFSRQSNDGPPPHHTAICFLRALIHTRRTFVEEEVASVTSTLAIHPNFRPHSSPVTTHPKGRSVSISPRSSRLATGQLIWRRWECTRIRSASLLLINGNELTNRVYSLPVIPAVCFLLRAGRLGERRSIWDVRDRATAFSSPDASFRRLGRGGVGSSNLIGQGRYE